MAKKTKSFSHIEAQNALEKLNESHPSGEELVYHLLSIFCGYGEGNIRRIREGVGNKAKDGRTVLIPNIIAYRSKGELDFHEEIKDMQSDARIVKQTPRLYVVSDGKTIVAADPKEQDIYENDVALMWKDFEFFYPLAGIEKIRNVEEAEADVKSAELMAKIFDEIRRHNDIKDKTEMHNLNIFMSRLLFCFFAEDTRLFPEPQLFTDSIRQHTAEDGHDLAEFIDRAFLAMSTDNPAVLDTLPKQFAIFPYVNGGLFEQRLPIPVLSRRARVLIIKCGDFNWKDINPDIFGSMIQAVVTPEIRAGLGMHYTSVPNIKKLIRPLFLDELNREFEVAKGTKDIKRLRKLLVRLGKIKFFDPACGSGNFLIVSYKCVRELEIQIWEVLRKWGEPELPMSNISLQQFYGIEIDDFACDTATLSLWLAEHQMNNKFETAFGIRPNALPLRPSGHIVCGNACRLNWETVCPHTAEEEVYVMGNPPYLGSALQDENQKEDKEQVLNKLYSYKDLDYISCWFYLGANYLKDTKAKCAYVSTNSICQGEQVSMLWKPIFNMKVEIYFAYTSFKWNNNAKSNAAVICIIVGIQNAESSIKKLYFANSVKLVKHITPYITEGEVATTIDKISNPISRFFPIMRRGNSPTDDGNLIFSTEERKMLISKYAILNQYIKRYIGSIEFINGTERWILYLKDSDLHNIESIDEIKERLSNVTKFRLNSKQSGTFQLASFPNRYFYCSYQETTSIIIPRHSSERREYIPIGYLEAGTVVADSAFAIYDAPLWLFGILTSKMHMAWVKTVGGRLKTDYRYSAQLCYNTFPFPAINEAQKAELEKLAQEVLDVRDQHFDMTLGEQYNPETMPEALKEVHHRLDLAVERCYRPEPFSSDEERLECLFKLYAKMTKKTDENAEKERLESIEKIFTGEIKSDRFCMCPNCSEKAIGSHVFSRAHILEPISNGKKEIYQFYRRPLIFKDDDIFCYKLEPIVKAFKFKGFCQHHDTFLFKSIEPKSGRVDWTKKESQYLLSYRTICREIYANIVMQNVCNKLLTKKGIEKYNSNILILQSQLTNLKLTKGTLDYYKSILERGIHNSNKDFADIHFQYLELPFQFDLCISAPIHVEDSRGLYNTDYQEINIINIFPYYGKTIILLGYLQEFDNKWMNEILPKFKSPYPHIVSSAFVDILYRAEFHAMSLSLYDSLDKDLLDAFLRTWQMEVNNYSNEIENEVSSLFYIPLNKLMPSTWKYL